MKEIIFINNIKERLFDLLPQKDFDSILDKLLNETLKDNHIWYDIKYINSCLELFFIYFNKFNKPLPVFYCLFNTSTIDLPSTISRQISFLKHSKEFINNDLNISENDFNLYKSILIYCNYVEVPTQNSSKLYGGLSSETDKGISFKFKGKIDRDKLIENMSFIIEEMTVRYEQIFNEEIKQIYLDKIHYLVSEYKNFKVR